MTRDLKEISADMEKYVAMQKKGKLNMKEFMQKQYDLIQEAIDHPETSNIQKKTMKKQLQIVKLGIKIGRMLK